MSTHLVCSITLSVTLARQEENIQVNSKKWEKQKKITTTLDANLQCSPSPEDVPGKTTHTSLPLMFSIVTQSNETLCSNAKARDSSSSLCYGVSLTVT